MNKNELLEIIEAKNASVQAVSSGDAAYKDMFGNYCIYHRAYYDTDKNSFEKYISRMYKDADRACIAYIEDGKYIEQEIELERSI